jgi:hypothetical protein
VRDAGTVETPTFTPTDTPTDTPTVTPTPTPWLDCGLLLLVDDLDRYTSDMGRINLEVKNLTGSDAHLSQTFIDWADTESQSNNPRINYLRFDGACDDTYWRTDFTNSPAIVTPPYRPIQGGGDCYDSDMVIEGTRTGDQDWDAYLYGGPSPRRRRRARRRPTLRPGRRRRRRRRGLRRRRYRQRRPTHRRRRPTPHCRT